MTQNNNNTNGLTRKVTLIVAVFCGINILLGWLGPLQRDRSRIDLLEQRQGELQRKIEELRSENKSDHRDIQSKLESLSNGLMVVQTKVDSLLKHRQVTFLSSPEVSCD